MEPKSSTETLSPWRRLRISSSREELGCGAGGTEGPASGGVRRRGRLELAPTSDLLALDRRGGAPSGYKSAGYKSA